MSLLLCFDFAWSSLHQQFSGHHEAQAIALLRLFQIVSGHQHRRARVRQMIDHGPERAAGQWINSGSRLVEKHNSRLVHDGAAESHALFPAARQTPCDLIFLALQAGKV